MCISVLAVEPFIITGAFEQCSVSGVSSDEVLGIMIPSYISAWYRHVIGMAHASMYQIISR